MEASFHINIKKSVTETEKGEAEQQASFDYRLEASQKRY